VEWTRRAGMCVATIVFVLNILKKGISLVSPVHCTKMRLTQLDLLIGLDVALNPVAVNYYGCCHYDGYY
jgi:hypothetical protein